MKVGYGRVSNKNSRCFLNLDETMLNLILILNLYCVCSPLLFLASLQSSIVDIPKEPFIFVRHASTNWTLESLSQGPQDLEINEKGREEALLASKILANEIKRFNKKPKEFVIIASTLKRALNTAEIISKHVKIPLVLNSGLEERYFGDFRLDKKFCEQARSFIPIDAESDIQFYTRISTAVKNIFNSKKNGHSIKILISHGEVFKYLSKSLTKEEKTIPHGGVGLFIPGIDNNWTCQILSNKENLGI